MIKVNENKKSDIKLVKHYIKDLSFENPQTLNENNSENNNNNNFSQNVSFIHSPYKNNFFSVVVKYACECSSKKNGKPLFVLELDYFGFFKITNNNTHNQIDLTKEGGELILPFMNSIIKDITKKGGSVPISIQEIDFDLNKV
mgnify:CR=1 FL=1